MTNQKNLKNSIKLLLCDVDGVLTDGGIYMNEKGEIIKRFNVKDGLGLVILQKAGVKTGILTADNSPIAEHRGKKLGLDHVIHSSKNKLEDAKKLCEQIGLTLKDLAFIGDDIIDQELLSHVGFAACPQDSHVVIKSMPGIFICEKNGGFGAVRELVDHILSE